MEMQLIVFAHDLQFFEFEKHKIKVLKKQKVNGTTELYTLQYENAADVFFLGTAFQLNRIYNKPKA